MIDLASSSHHLDHPVRLNAAFKSDLTWWHIFLDTWNGVSCMQPLFNATPDAVLYTDASGNWGCDAICFPNWFPGQTTPLLLPIVIAIALWGHQWTRQQVLCRCDNMAVVHLLHTRSSKDHIIMHLLRSLHFFLACRDIRLHATHIPGKFNVLADANHLQVFRQQAPTANPEGTRIPQLHQEMLITTRPDCNSPAWENRLKDFLKMV